MFRGFISLLIASASVWALPPQPPAEVYYNKTTVQNPQVNARNFINEGSITAFGTTLWDPQNTVNFTNRARMFGAPGFRFETVSAPFGIRTPANAFFNSSAGEILAQDTGGFGFIIDGAGGTFNFSSTSLIKVNANSVTNRGLINVGANGFIQLHGRSVDLTAGALVVGDLNDPLSGGGFGGGFPDEFDTNFFPAVGIYDEAWGIGNYTNTRVANVIGGLNPNRIATPTPAPRLTNDFGGTQSGAIQLNEALVWVREDMGESNEVVQIIAVQVSDPNITVNANFVAENWWDDEPVGEYLTAIVELQVKTTDFATFDIVTNSLYIADQLGSSTNRALILNNRFGTYRPGNFVVFRDDPNLYGNSTITNVREDIFLTNYSNPYDPKPYGNIVTSDWAGYVASVESVAARLPLLPDVAITNQGGQVEVYSHGDLVLRNTRIRGEGFVTLNGTNVLINGTNIVDTPRLGINFGSGSGDLRINEFVPDFVERFNGTFRAASYAFTNVYERTNLAPATDIYSEPTIETNQVEVHFQITIVDARGLQTREPVTVYDLKLTSTNGPASINFNESLTLLNDVRMDARNITFGLGSQLDIPFGLSYTNLIDVRTLTNFGSIFAGEAMDLRTDLNTPFESFFNAGILFGNGVDIWADQFANLGGSIGSQTVIDIRARDLRIEGNEFNAVSDIRLVADNANISGLTLNTGARLVLDVSQSLNDAGPYARNTFSVNGGVEMTPVRPSGDLLGTVINLQARPGDIVNMVWSGVDRGPVADGFQNNLALGLLNLNGGRFSLFEFQPALPGSALYVDLLVLSGTNTASLALLTNSVILGMNVYYSDVLTPLDPYSDVNAQSLDRVFGPNAPFNFIWVPSFIGPSSVEVQLGKNGTVTRMNRSVRQSMVIDSDGDGVPNAVDPYPLTAGTESNLELINVKRNASAISFNLNGSPSAKYVIEHTTNLQAPNWKAVSGTLTSSELSGSAAFSQAINQTATQGYYRVRVVP
jgi:hypothetical protein